MTIADTLKNFVEQLMISARIVSPRFTDYRVDRLDYYTEPADFSEVLREEIKRILAEEKADVGVTGGIEQEAGTQGLSEGQLAGMVGRGISTAQNPASAATGLIRFLPHAALVALAISLAPLIIKELKKPGSMLDIRFKRIMQDEFNAFLGRQDQWDTKLGLRQVRVQSKSGFLVTNGSAMTENNLRQVREGGTDGDRLALIEMSDLSKELFP